MRSFEVSGWVVLVACGLFLYFEFASVGFDLGVALLVYYLVVLVCFLCLVGYCFGGGYGGWWGFVVVVEVCCLMFGLICGDCGLILFVMVSLCLACLV